VQQHEQDLAEKLAEAQGLTKADARKTVDAVFSIADAAAAAMIARWLWQVQGQGNACARGPGLDRRDHSDCRCW
jgi:hypothetical protein